MSVLVVKFYAKSGLGDTVAAALQRMASLVEANEPGCMFYHVCRARNNPDIFLLYEQYVDDQAMAVHRNTPYFKEIIEGELFAILEKREPEFYTLIVD